MSSEVKFENQGTGVVVTYTGVVTGEDIRAMNAYIYASDHLPRIRYQLFDFTKADRLEVTNEDVRFFAMQDKAASEQNPHMIGAIIGDMSLYQGYERIFRVYSQIWSGIPTEFFTTIEEGRAWVASRLKE
jgi:hypothetical protein